MSVLILPNQPQNDEEVLVAIFNYLQMPKPHYNQRHRIENMEKILGAFTALELNKRKKSNSLIMTP